MSRITYIAFLFLAFSFKSYAQDIGHLYTFPSKIPDKYIFNTKSSYDSIIKKKMRGAGTKDIERYAEAAVYGKQHLFTSGKVYLGWDEMEAYLNKVLQQILPDSLKNKPNIYVYPARQSEHNAYAIHDGALFVNIGLLADIHNEAALAIILGHELSHYLNQDYKKSYIKGLSLYTKANRNRNLVLALDKAHLDQEQEKVADRMGFMFAEKGGYDIYYGISNFNQFKEQEVIAGLKKAKSRLMTTDQSIVVKDRTIKIKALDDLLATHPSLEDRVTYLEKYLESADRRNNKKDFIVGRELFEKLQEKAKLETLNILLTQNDFNKCIQKAFVYYMTEPLNDNYVYFILESIRRATYIDQSLKKKGFLTEDNRSKRFKKGEGILHDLSYILPDSMKFASVKATEFIDTSIIEFETYEQAFNYFRVIAEKRHIKESYLSIALFQSIELKRNSYLQEYLAFGDIRHKAFATAVLNNRLFEELATNNRELVLTHNINFIEDHYYGYHNKQLMSETLSPAYFTLLREELKKASLHKELINIDEFSFSDLNKRIEYENILTASLYTTTQENQYEVYTPRINKKEELADNSTNVFLINPDYWDFCLETKIKSLDFVKISSFDDQTKIASIVARKLFWNTLMLTSISLFVTVEDKETVAPALTTLVPAVLISDILSAAHLTNSKRFSYQIYRYHYNVSGSISYDDSKIDRVKITEKRCAKKTIKMLKHR